jgi:hypothetical protein
MRAAVDGVDVVGEREHVLCVGVVVLEGDLDRRRALAALDVDGSGVEDLLVPVQMPHERREAALEVERALALDPLVDELDPDLLVEVRRLPQALRDQVERVVDRLEHLGVGPELGPRTAPTVRRTDLLDRALGLAARVLLEPDRPVTRRFDTHPFGERVDHAHADAVETAGHLVSAATELPAGVQHGVNHLEGVLAGRVAPHRDPAPVVLDDDRAVRPDRDVDTGRVARHGLVDRVVDDLPDEVVQATQIGGPDVHPRAPSDRFEALEDLDAFDVVVAGTGLRPAGLLGAGVHGPTRFLGHADPPVRRSYRRPSSSSL